MTDPINLQVRRADDTWDIIEAAPLLTEDRHELKSTGTFQLYQGFPHLTNTALSSEAHEKYLESLALMGEDNPGYLGELHFTGLAYFEWKYEGNRLTEKEVWQIVDCIQDLAAGKYRPSDNGVYLAKENHTPPPPLQFKYGKNRLTYQISIEEMKEHFVVLVDGEPLAQLEFLEKYWEITSGDIYDSDLLAEIIHRIKANTSGA